MNFDLKLKSLYNYVYAVIALIVAFWLISLYELYLSKPSAENEFSFWLTLVYKFINDFWSGLVIGVVIMPFYLIISAFSKKTAFIVTSILFTIMVILQFSLVKYSLTTLLNLGADILGYSYDDVFSTVSVSESISVTYFLPFIIFPLLFFGFYILFKKYGSKKLVVGIGTVSILVFGSLKLILANSSNERFQNKIAFLTSDIIKFKSEKNRINNYDFINRKDYPLLKPTDKSEDVLSPFFISKEEKPNIVVIVAEGLGAEFVDGNTFSGFTPYLDKLISKSLYWENFVSTTGRSFGILPSLFGSLPYGEQGFLELVDTPSHLSLISILKANGYQTSYYSGGPSDFDRKVNFLEYNGVENIIDEKKYGPEFVKTQSNAAGFSWGYPDSEIFRKAISSFNVEKQPRLDIIMTISNHEPFEFPDKERYMAKVDNILKESRETEALKNQILSHRDIFGCLLYTDETIEEFMEAYSKRPDYDNTIFIITGDHRLIPIEQKDKLCRFHVPFLIFSPMLKKAEKFKSVSSHWDVAPSVISYLMQNHKFNPIKETAWMGTGLDTVKQFRNTKSIPLMKYKGSINDMIYKDYLLSGDELFKINENFGTYKVTEEALFNTITDSLIAFKKMNAYITQRNKIFPDSLNIYVTPKVKFSEEEMVTINTYAKGKTFDELLLIARDLAFNKKYKTSRLLCDFILNEFPNYTDARILKGRTLAWDGKYEDSEVTLTNAMQRSPYYDDAYLAILDMYWWSNQEEKSISIFESALKNEMTNPEISFKMAKAFQRLGNIDKATKVMDSIVKIYPDHQDYITFKQTLSKVE